jgi:hypothetical protein
VRIATILLAAGSVAVAPAEENVPAGPKQPVPSTAVQDEVAKKLADIFDFTKATKPQEQLALAKELFRLGREIKDNPHEEFVLLRKTMELACAGGDAKLMIDAIDRIGHRFDVDPMTVKATMLTTFARDAKGEEMIRSLMSAAQPVVQRAVDDRQYEAANRLIEALHAAAQRPGGTEYRKPLADKRSGLRKLSEQYEEYKKAQAAIETNPSDHAASLVLGRWHCLVEGDWEQGLFYLVEGTDAELKSAATLELDGPSGAEAQAKVGDAWWDLAGKRSGDAAALRKHAAAWYEKAMPGLAGLPKLKVEKRLKEREETTAPAGKQEDDKPKSPSPPAKKAARGRQITFRADKSMQPYPPGTQHGQFPLQASADPRGPFEGQPVYFQQRTGQDVYYEIQWHPPVRQIRYRGAAWQNMTVQVLDPKGKVVAQFGPRGGGNEWLECALEVPPGAGNRFVLRFHNEISAWFFIAAIELR